MPNGQEQIDVVREEMRQLVSNARRYNKRLGILGVVMAFCTVVLITYIWLFYNP